MNNIKKYQKIKSWYFIFVYLVKSQSQGNLSEVLDFVDTRSCRNSTARRLMLLMINVSGALARQNGEDCPGLERGSFVLPRFFLLLFLINAHSNLKRNKEKIEGLALYRVKSPSFNSDKTETYGTFDIRTKVQN